jgi:predicted SAM-dependent methyltransferase
MKGLEVGSGMKPRLDPGWVNVDVVDFGNNVVHDLTVFPWPFDDDTFDHVEALDTLEHLPRGDAGLVSAINEMIRVCKPGGLIIIRGPDALYPVHCFNDPEHTGGFGPSLPWYWVKGSEPCELYGASKNKGKYFLAADVQTVRANYDITFTCHKAE